MYQTSGSGAYVWTEPLNYLNIPYLSTQYWLCKTALWVDETQPEDVPKGANQSQPKAGALQGAQLVEAITLWICS